jgi:hypothetical protein
MKKNSDNTLGTRYTSAKKIETILKKLDTYKPIRDEESVENFGRLLTELELVNKEVSATKQSAFLSKHARSEMFSRGTYSIKKILTRIASSVRSQYGFGNPATKNIFAVIKTLHGTTAKSQPDSTADPTKKDKSGNVSQSHLEFGTVLHNFKDLVVKISLLDPAFHPANEAITIQNLINLHDQLETVNNKLDAAETDFTKALNRREQLYSISTDSMKRIKQTFISQFGTDSPEYLSISSIRVS